MRIGNFSFSVEEGARLYATIRYYGDPDSDEYTFPGMDSDDIYALEMAIREIKRRLDLD